MINLTSLSSLYRSTFWVVHFLTSPNKENCCKLFAMQTSAFQPSNTSEKVANSYITIINFFYLYDLDMDVHEHT